MPLEASFATRHKTAPPAAHRGKTPEFTKTLQFVTIFLCMLFDAKNGVVTPCFPDKKP